jgi:Polyketide cyclase / dehydrase and lipid transport
MKMFHVEASDVINARPEALYAVVADYQVGHPAILPKPYFTELTVEKGGTGAGTIIRGSVKAFGNVIPLHHIVSEPEPGRVLMETDIETGQYTTFTFEPLNGGTQTRVTIASEFPTKPGLVGWMESVTTTPFVRRLYKQELRNLADYVRNPQPA